MLTHITLQFLYNEKKLCYYRYDEGDERGSTNHVTLPDDTVVVNIEGAKSANGCGGNNSAKRSSGEGEKEEVLLSSFSFLGIFVSSKILDVFDDTQ